MTGPLLTAGKLGGRVLALATDVLATAASRGAGTRRRGAGGRFLVLQKSTAAQPHPPEGRMPEVRVGLPPVLRQAATGRGAVGDAGRAAWRLTESHRRGGATATAPAGRRISMRLGGRPTHACTGARGTVRRGIVQRIESSSIASCRAWALSSGDRAGASDRGDGGR